MLTQDEAALTRLLDEAAIRDAIARFADAAATGDYAMVRSVWAEGGEFVIGQPPHDRSAKGADEATAMPRRLRDGLDDFVQFPFPGAISSDGDEATLRTFCHESARGPGEHHCRNHCVAFDRLRRSGGGRVFASRPFRHLWLDTAPSAGTGFPLLPDAAAA